MANHTVYYILINGDDSAEIEKHIVKVLEKDAKYEFERTYGVYDAVLKVYDIHGNVRDLVEKIKNPKIHCTLILSVIS